jgi:hypothetical protein
MKKDAAPVKHCHGDFIYSDAIASLI